MESLLAGRPLLQWEKYGYTGADSDGAFDLNFSAMGPHDLHADRQSKATTLGLGGEKRHKELVFRIRYHTAPLILETDEYPGIITSTR